VGLWQRMKVSLGLEDEWDEYDDDYYSDDADDDDEGTPPPVVRSRTSRPTTRIGRACDA